MGSEGPRRDTWKAGSQTLTAAFRAAQQNPQIRLLSPKAQKSITGIGWWRRAGLFVKCTARKSCAFAPGLLSKLKHGVKDLTGSGGG